MQRPKPFSLTKAILLCLYLLVLLGLGSYLLWPQRQELPLRVSSVQLAPEGDRILLEGEGFSAATQVSLALDVSNRRFLRHRVPTWGRVGTLLRVGRFAYLTDLLKGLVILDLAEPQRPRIVGSLALPGRARNLAVEGGIACVACDGAGLVLVDVGTPGDPRLLATLPEVQWAQGMAVRDGRLFATVFSTAVAPALVVMDISDPRRPQLLGRMSLPGQPLAVRFWGERLLIAAGKAGLLCLEWPPGQALPRMHSQLALPNRAFALEVVGALAYVACGHQGVAVIALDQAGPRLLDRLPLPINVTQLVAEAERLYLGGGSSGGLVLDIALPGQPRLLGAFEAPGGRPGLAVLDRTLYLTTEKTGIEVFDVSEPAQVQVAEQLFLEESILTLQQTPDLLVATTAGGHLHLLERRPAGLRRLASLRLQGPGQDLEIRGGLAYVSIPGRGLEVIDLRTPQAPVSRGLYPWGNGEDQPGARRNTLALVENQGVVVDGSGRLRLFAPDASGALKFRPGPPLPAKSHMVKSGTDLFYAATGTGRLAALDLRQPLQPRIYPHIALPVQQINDVAVMGRVAVLACGLEGLLTVDFSHSAAPRLLAALALPLNASRLQLQGTTAYVLDLRGGLLAIDLSEPARPRLLGQLDHGLEVKDFAVVGSQAVLATDGSGLVVVPLPQILRPLALEEGRMSLTLPPIDTPGHYTLRLTDGRQTLDLPGALALGLP